MGGETENGPSGSARATTVAVRTAVAVLAAGALVGPVRAHSGSLGGAVADATVPTWLTVLTGGIVVGATFLFTTLLTDHDAMRGVNWWRTVVPTPPSARRAFRWGSHVVGVAGLALVLATGFAGPSSPRDNFALLLVWAGWWAGYTMTTYLVGNTWPALNPWRTLARAVRAGVRTGGRTVTDRDSAGENRSVRDGGSVTDGRAARTVGTGEAGRDEGTGRDGGAGGALPDGWGVWPAVAGLVALVFLEVVSPIGQQPAALAAVVAGYTLVTVAGAVALGDAWFDRVDPVSHVFAVYGRVAPVQRDEDGGLTLRLPGTALTDDPLPDRPGETAFVVALLWVTTYDGLVATPAWATAIEALVDLGVPALLVYVAVMLAGFGCFLGVYRLAARRIRERADTYVTVAAIERWFAPALLPIAAGYHVAHFLGYFVTLSPTLYAVAASPFAPPANPLLVVLPDWFGTVKLAGVLLGHVLAVWVAHSLAFELFPGVLAAIRSQVPSVVVMVFYTMVSLWVITQPYVPPPFV